MSIHVSDLLLATTVRAQQFVFDWAESAQPQAQAAGPVQTGVTMQCDWVDQARDVVPKVENWIGNLWGILATYGGLAVIVFAILIAFLGKFAVGRRLMPLFLWTAAGLLVVGTVIQIVQNSLGGGCS